MRLVVSYVISVVCSGLVTYGIAYFRCHENIIGIVQLVSHEYPKTKDLLNITLMVSLPMSLIVCDMISFVRFKLGLDSELIQIMARWGRGIVFKNDKNTPPLSTLSKLWSYLVFMIIVLILIGSVGSRLACEISSTVGATG
jgi:hypothetical protein